MTVALVAIGGAAGATLRYLIDRRVARRGSPFPFGTLLVNVMGSAVLGILAGLALSGRTGSALDASIAIGLCGSLTTYSTFGYETIHLLTERARLEASLNVAATVLAGLAAAGGGLLLGRLLVS